MKYILYHSHFKAEIRETENLGTAFRVTQVDSEFKLVLVKLGHVTLSHYVKLLTS
jgi:sorbitol-specific phosphotransferase system component IIA